MMFDFADLIVVFLLGFFFGYHFFRIQVDKKVWNITGYYMQKELFDRTYQEVLEAQAKDSFERQFKLNED
jgi:hypothetical protein